MLSKTAKNTASHSNVGPAGPIASSIIRARSSGPSIVAPRPRMSSAATIQIAMLSTIRVETPNSRS
jgi:hypothetical protein